MRKRQVIVGEFIPGTRLKVLAIEPSGRGGNQMVRIESFCGSTKIMRLTAITMQELAEDYKLPLQLITTIFRRYAVRHAQQNQRLRWLR